jgi:hypothetical protein
MSKVTRSSAVERFRTTLDLFEMGEKMMRQNLRRRYPEDGNEEIERRLIEWLQHRPGAEHGDCDGKPIDWPR